MNGSSLYNYRYMYQHAVLMSSNIYIVLLAQWSLLYVRFFSKQDQNMEKETILWHSTCVHVHNVYNVA